MDTIDQLNWRYATKQFDPDRKLSEEQVELLQEALRLSASSFGLQPWKFLFYQGSECADLVAHSYHQSQPHDCSHLIVMCAPLEFVEADVDRFLDSTVEQRGVEPDSVAGYGRVMKDFLGRMDEPALEAWMKNQIYLALGSLLVVCAAEGIDACPMEGFDSTAYDKALGLPEQGLTSVVLCPVGFRAESDKYATLAKVRYPKEEVVERRSRESLS